ncbi:site-specific integrase [uncultured Campylobacter sp.]|uniref:tyrosine-type recombinase/integrase n=1 Tax=uncultured Campylobacter sp. TaxID=218934 RepID=UPI00260EE556|nr:site-specific integrase [uncultured Campylobacter sp.]
MKFKYFSDLFLQIGSNSWKPSTIFKYESIVVKRLNFLYDREIESIKASELRLWFSQMNKEVSAKTLRDYKSCLNQIFQLAKYDEFIKNNPIDYIRNFNLVKPKIQPFTNTEVNRILEASKAYSSKFQMFLKIGFYTGMRTGEILALKKENIDFKKKLINVELSRSKFGENSPKTAGSIRQVPIVDALYYDLWCYCRLTFTAYLFVNQYCEPYNTDFSFTRYCWKPLLKSLGIPYRKLYVMRHTYATNILKNTDISPYELSRLLGHSSTEMVFNRYVKFIENQKDEFKRDVKIY